MGAIEVVLIILGIVVFVASFLLPARKTDSVQETPAVKEEDIHEILEKEVTGVKTQISEIADETITYSMEKTERSMERLTNEKIMAINEYSDTVLSEINKNHKEVVFLYDMLNDKHENLLSTVSEASKTASDIKLAVNDAEISAKEAEEKVRRVQESINEAITLAQAKADEVQELERKLQELAAERAEKEKEYEFRPITPQRVEILREIPEAALSGGNGAAGSPEDVPANTEGQKKRTRKPRTVKKDRQTENTAGEGMAVEKAPIPHSAASDIAAAIHSVEQQGGNNNERILELHRSGKSNVAIAKELGLGIGEVKLVIDLFEGI